MDKRTHDSYPIRLTGGRKVLVTLPTEFTAADAERIEKWLDLVALHSAEIAEEKKNG